MANKHKGEVDIKIGGMDRILKFDNNAIADVEGLFDDKPIHVIVANGVGVKAMKALLYHGVQWQGKAPTLNQVGDMLGDTKTKEYLAERLGQALSYYLGVDDKNEEAGETPDTEKN